MPDHAVNYDQVAPTYHHRYTINPLPGVAAALHALIEQHPGGRILEAGCGTGRWLYELAPHAACVYGLDRSPGMLAQARQVHAGLDLACGDAARLPLPDACLDFVFCVNALHHFGRPRRFIQEAQRALRPSGHLAIVGMDPHTGQDEWYIYEYFPETRPLDLKRFPSGETILGWMAADGFQGLAQRPAEHILNRVAGPGILDDHFLQKEGTSQLTLLSDEAYAAGLERIRAALARAEARGETAELRTSITLMLFTGQAPPA